MNNLAKRGFIPLKLSNWVQIPTRKILGLAGQEDVLEGNFFPEEKISPWLAKNSVH